MSIALVTKTPELNVPPQAIEAEQSVLGGLMLDNTFWDDVSAILSKEDFYTHTHRAIFESMLNLSTQSKPMDAITISEFLGHENNLDKIGGIAYLIELTKTTATAANTVAYAEIVRERSVRRQLIAVSNHVAKQAYTSQQPIEEILDQSEKDILSISEQQNPSTITTEKELLKKLIVKLDKLHKADSHITGVPSGFEELDKLTAGFQAGDLIILAARPSMGKTCLALNFAEHVVLHEKKPVLFFSLEMSPEQVMSRIVSSSGNIDGNRLKTGQLIAEEWCQLSTAVAKIGEGGGLIIEQEQGRTPMKMRSFARRAQKQYGELGLIVVDYLQMVTSKGSENRTLEVSDISRALKLLATEMNVPVVAVSQLNRNIETRSDKRPLMSDLRDSGTIEQDADLILFIYREEVYDKDTDRKGVADITIAKHRNGELGSFELLFEGQYSKFSSLGLVDTFY